MSNYINTQVIEEELSTMTEEQLEAKSQQLIGKMMMLMPKMNDVDSKTALEIAEVFALLSVLIER